MPRNQPSGLLKSIELVRNISGIATIELNAGDVVRHRLVARIIEAFESDK
ncbi:MAG: PhoH family protein [Flavobacteriales bacterium]